LGGGGIIWDYDRILTSRDIVLTVPASGASPQTAVTDTQFTASVSWEDVTNGVTPFTGTFASGNTYRAVITVTPVEGYTLVGIRARHFTVNGAVPAAANAVSSGVVGMDFTVP
jgi:hypothetical protein